VFGAGLPTPPRPPTVGLRPLAPETFGRDQGHGRETMPQHRMIRNERQYRITKAQAEKFSRALEEASARTSTNPLLHQLGQDAIRSQLQDLQRDLQKYELLRAGQERVLTLDSLAEFPRALVKARIAAGLTQKDLADRLGLKEQQIQRYAATEYATASVARLMRVIEALGIRVREEVLLDG
jgi:ribosome-binding protein aMBF1 (putative translation factor)